MLGFGKTKNGGLSGLFGKKARKSGADANFTEAKCLEGINGGKLVLGRIPLACRTQAVCNAAVGRNASALEFVPREYRTDELCLTAVKARADAIAFVPLHQRTIEMCLDAVGRCGDLLKYVPVENRTLEVCAAAVRNDPESIENVPEILRTRAGNLARDMDNSDKADSAGVKENGNDALDNDPLFCGPDGGGGAEPAPASDAAAANGAVPDNSPAEPAGQIPDQPENAPAEAVPSSSESMPVPGTQTLADGTSEDSGSEALSGQPETMPFADNIEAPLPEPRPQTRAAVAGQSSKTPAENPGSLFAETAFTDMDEPEKEADDGLAPDDIQARVWLNGLKEGVCGLADVPEELRSAVLCRKAVGIWGHELANVPEALRDEALCLAAVKDDGRALEFVPEALRTRELCEEAISHVFVSDSGPSFGVLEFVPDGLKNDQELIAEAVDAAPGDLLFVPEELVDERLCLSAVASCGEMLRAIPEEMRTRAVCLAACLDDGKAFAHVPEELRTREFCLEAIGKWAGKAFFDAVPQKFWFDRMFCLLAARTAAINLLDRMPPAAQTVPVCLASVRCDGLAIQFVPRDRMTRDICLAAVQRNPEAIRFVPARMQDEALCLAAVKASPRALLHITEAGKTVLVCTEALLRDESLRGMGLVPEAIKAEVDSALGLPAA